MNWIDRTLTKHDLSLASTSLGSLAKKYGTTPQEIAKQNGVPWTSDAVNQWVLSVGGREITPGNFTFVVGNRIKLPAVAVIPDPTEVVAPIQAATGGSGWLLGMALIGGGILIYRRLRKRKRRGAVPKPILFS